MITECEDCGLEWENCVCNASDKFFKEHPGLWEDLAEPSLPSLEDNCSD